jgi:hypothetical protein
MTTCPYSVVQLYIRIRNFLGLAGFGIIVPDLDLDPDPDPDPDLTFSTRKSVEILQIFLKKGPVRL